MSGLVARRAGFLFIQAMDSAKVVSSINENENCTVTHSQNLLDLHMKQFSSKVSIPTTKTILV